MMAPIRTADQGLEVWRSGLASYTWRTGGCFCHIRPVVAQPGVDERLMHCAPICSESLVAVWCYIVVAAAAAAAAVFGDDDGGGGGISRT